MTDGDLRGIGRHGSYTVCFPRDYVRITMVGWLSNLTVRAVRSVSSGSLVKRGVPSP